jgi:pimeloyl-ACP methyl ester carboxylesterase
MKEEVIVQGLKTSYRVAGYGQPVVILHGWGSNMNPWAKTQDIIASRQFKVVVPDLVGFGKSDLPPNGWSMDDYATWFEDFILELSKKHKEYAGKIFLMGHSFGGRISIKIAARKSVPLRGLILCGAAGLKADATLKLRIISTIAKSGKKTIDRIGLYKLKDPLRDFYYHLLRQDDYNRVPKVMKKTFRRVIEEDLSKHLPEIDIDTFIVWGAKDRIVPVKQAYRFHHNIKHSTIKIMANSGHSPQIDEPEELASLLIDFLRKV